MNVLGLESFLRGYSRRPSFGSWHLAYYTGILKTIETPKVYKNYILRQNFGPSRARPNYDPTFEF